MSDAPRDARTDEQLVAALRRGDAAAFDALYLRYRDFVVRLAHRLCGEPSDALDVLQDTFLYVLRKAPALELRARFTTFLFPVVRNLALARRKHRRRAAPAEAEPADAAAAATRREDLIDALGGLPEDQREAVLLRFVDGLSLAEVADVQQVPIGTVKSRLHQAIAALRTDPRARRYFLG